MPKLTESQAQVLERYLAGDRLQTRNNFQFCFDERSRYVYVWESDRKTVVSKRTKMALFDKGYFYAGEVTDAGRAALVAYRAKFPPLPSR